MEYSLAVAHSSTALSLEEIVEAGLCIGCGLCQGVVGGEQIEMVLTPEGRERPVARGALDNATLARINAVCPGTRIEGAVPSDAPRDTVWVPRSIWPSVTRATRRYATGDRPGEC